MKILAFLYPGHEVWNHFQPLAKLLRQLGHEVLIADFSPHIPGDEDLPVEPPVPRLTLSDQGEGTMARMDRATYLRLHGNDVDFGASALYYHTLEQFALKRKWLFLDSPFYQRLYGLAHRVDETIDAVRPDLAIVAHGINPLPATVVAKCRSRNLPVLLFESPFFPGKLSVDADGVHFLPGINRLDRVWPRIRDTALTLDQEERLDEFLRTWRNSNSSKYSQANDVSELERMDVFVGKARDEGRQIVFIPEQVAWDASVFLGLDRYSSWEAFAQDAIETLPAETRIIYKRHPRRRDIDASIADSDRMIVVRDVSIHSIFSVVDGVCTFSSNAGFEALLSGLPVVCGGLPHYGNRGFTSRDVRDLAPLTAEQRTLLRRYAHHVIFEYLVDQDDPDALAARIGEAMTERGQLTPPDKPLAAAFPDFVQTYTNAIAEYNARAAANVTHKRAVPGIEDTVDPALRARIDLAQTDVDNDGLLTERQYVDRIEDADPAAVACYRLAAALLPDGGFVLDAGCGCGFGCGILADESSATVLGIDAAKDAIDTAWVKWHRENRVEYKQLSVDEFLANDDRMLNGITCFGLTEFLACDKSLLESLWSRLQPLGLLMMSFVNATQNRLEHDGQVRFRTRTEITEMLSALPGAGFSSVLGVLPSGDFVNGNIAPRYLAIAQKRATTWEPALFEVRLLRALKAIPGVRPTAG